MSYFITNGNQFLRFIRDSDGKITMDYEERTDPNTSSHFKLQDALDMLSSIGDSYNVIKIRRTNKHKDYVISDATLFVSTYNKKSASRVSTDYTERRIFKSVADAQAYISNNQIFSDAIIVDDKWKQQDSSVRHFTDEQLQILGVAPVKKKTPRVYIKKSIRQQVYEQGNGICAICGKPVTYEEFTVDHINPLANGGKNDLSNYQIACFACNQLKSDSVNGEYITSATNIVANRVTEENELAKPIIRSYVRSLISGMYGAGFAERVLN